METNHGSIEHERNRNQGKRPNQLHYAAKVWFWFNIAFLIGVIIWVALGIKDY